MIRAALIALALCAPAYAATTDLTLTLIDGRPAFRPADGLDCWSSKFGGQAIDCVLLDASLVRPKRAPCWLRDYPDRVCPVSQGTMALLPAVRAEPLRPRITTAGGTTAWASTGWTAWACCDDCETVAHEPPPVMPPVPSVPLPGAGWMMMAAVAVMMWRRNNG